MKITEAAAGAWADARKSRKLVGAFILSDGTRTGSWMRAHEDWAKDPENVRRFRDGLVNVLSQPSPLYEYFTRRSDRMNVDADER